MSLVCIAGTYIYPLSPVSSGCKANKSLAYVMFGLLSVGKKELFNKKEALSFDEHPSFLRYQPLFVGVENDCTLVSF
jgi:hypothetical protein